MVMERLAGLTRCCVVAAGSTVAFSYGGVIEREPAPAHWFDQFKESMVVFEDPSAKGIQRFAITGRLQYDFAYLEDDSEEISLNRFRRSRLGFTSELFDEFRVDFQADFELNRADPAYAGLSYGFVQWQPNPDLRFRLGKQFASFTLDGTTSSARLLTMEANDLSRNVWGPEVFVPGFSMRWKPSDFWIDSGIYSGGSSSDEFGNFDGSFGIIQKFGYDMSEHFGVEEASMELDYFYQEPDLNNDFIRPFQHVGSIQFRYDDTRWGFRSDLVGARGKLGQSDKGGVVIMPFYRFTENLEWVNRVTWMKSKNENGIRLGNYENRIARGRGNEYLELYSGLNVYLRGHDLKWQFGFRHIDLVDEADDGGAYDGWSVSTGIRINW